MSLTGLASGSWVAGAVYQSHGASFTFACFGTFALVSYKQFLNFFYNVAFIVDSRLMHQLSLGLVGQPVIIVKILTVVTHLDN